MKAAKTPTASKIWSKMSKAKSRELAVDIEQAGSKAR